MALDWWPAAQTGAWDWRPAVHVGALLLAAAPHALAVLLARAHGAEPRPRDHALLALSTAILVLTLGWPIGDLAAVSLAGRTAQYLLITLAAAPLFLLGVPGWRAARRGLARRLVEHALASPLLGAVVLAVVVWVTHFPAVVDGFEASASGEAAVRATWIVAGLVFWWPLVGPGPARERLSYLAGLGYLMLPFVFPKFPAAVWIFSSDAVYESFQGVARPGGLSVAGDQGLAGFLLWLPGSVMVAVAIYLLLRHWLREDRRLTLRQRLGVPAHPDAVAILVAHPRAWSALETLVAIVDEAAPPRSGADLAFSVRRERVVLQLHFPGTEEEQAALGEAIEARYAAYLERATGAEATEVRALLSFEILPYGSRVL